MVWQRRHCKRDGKRANIVGMHKTILDLINDVSFIIILQVMENFWRVLVTRGWREAIAEEKAMPCSDLFFVYKGFLGFITLSTIFFFLI